MLVLKTTCIDTSCVMGYLFKWANRGIYFIHQNFFVISRIGTAIVGVEGAYADHYQGPEALKSML